MSIKSVWQLKKLTLRYCSGGGSSRGVRDYLQSPLKKDFELSNPQVQLETLVKKSKHPILVAEYANGSKSEICVKNLPADQVHDYVIYTRNKRDAHHRTWSEKHRQVTRKPSIQGVWHPDQWLPLFEYKEKQ
eukprot:TRINITY_DN3511_c0_g1_i2.p1 TRINITY_DN3511_c0_g1~~TRINITY_DN3511_c0_g1_i2.p1  ORF type:complete len:132 (-),score=27.45 TRINITY_DN3511_c0_g1_i2:15-410(-)